MTPTFLAVSTARSRGHHTSRGTIEIFSRACFARAPNAMSRSLHLGSCTRLQPRLTVRGASRVGVLRPRNSSAIVLFSREQQRTDFQIVVRTGCPALPDMSQNTAGHALNEKSVASISSTMASMLGCGVPGTARPDKSPLTSAANIGTPSRENPSANRCKETVAQVPVAHPTKLHNCVRFRRTQYDSRLIGHCPPCYQLNTFVTMQQPVNGSGYCTARSQIRTIETNLPHPRARHSGRHHDQAR